MLSWEKILSKVGTYENVQWITTKVVAQVCGWQAENDFSFPALEVPVCHQLSWPPKPSKEFSSGLRMHEVHTDGPRDLVSAPLVWDCRTLGALSYLPAGATICRLEYIIFPNVEIPYHPLVFQFIKLNIPIYLNWEIPLLIWQSLFHYCYYTTWRLDVYQQGWSLLFFFLP